MVNQFTMFISVSTLLLAIFRSFVNSNRFSLSILALSFLFYGNAYFDIFDIAKATGMYLSLLLMGCIFVAFKALSSMQEIHQIDGLKKLPVYDCMEISLISNFEDTYELLDPYQKDFTKFKFYYKNCYAYGGWIYHDGEKHEFSNVSNYLNEQKIDINKLTSDDFKVISMIFI
jgi:hypothetical protein